MILPTEQQCLDYFDKYKVPKNIFRHCLKVREVAVFLAEEWEKQGRAVDKEFVTCLALLHDLFKAVTFP
ncbi:MAG: HD domain-containing protein, partial [Nanoarchaeota archaeon]|nr:HD domain-containing protein [Nanoarchaeota archaeon]